MIDLNDDKLTFSIKPPVYDATVYPMFVDISVSG